MVEILLATYNGERYLKAQLDSILRQTYTDWHLTVQDDCSTDNTLEVLKCYQKKYQNKILILQNTIRFGSAKNNFFSLLLQTTGQYIMFCDQDDIWLESKIQITLDKLQQMESESQINTPILVHADLTVVDENVKVIDHSLFHMQKMNAQRIKPRQLVAQNIVTGCTVMINQTLCQLLKDTVPADAIMHDWWLALLASCFGKIGFIDKPLILYRQHGKNAIGAKNAHSFFYKVMLLNNLKQVKQNISDTYIQSGCFYEIYRSNLTNTQNDMFLAYASIPTKKKIGRCLTAWRLGTVKNGLLRKLASIIYL